MAQLVKSNRFQRFDYGSQVNMAKYGQCEPPVIDLNCINTPVHLIGAERDIFSPLKDQTRLVKELNK